MTRAARNETEQRLLDLLELEQGYWFGVVVSDFRPARWLVRDLAREWCEANGRAFHHHQPRAEGLRELVVTLAREATDGIHWINTDGEGLAGPEWGAARTAMLFGMNERREVFRKLGEVGVLLEGPASLKRELREQAPDLFVDRACVLEPDEIPAREPRRSEVTLPTADVMGPMHGGDPEAEWQRAEALAGEEGEAVDRVRADALVRAAEGWLGREEIERAGQALELAAPLVAKVRSNPESWSELLALRLRRLEGRQAKAEGRDSDAEAIFFEIIEGAAQFPNEDEPRLAEIVRTASEAAKMLWDLGRPDEALAVHTRVERYQPEGSIETDRRLNRHQLWASLLTQRANILGSMPGRHGDAFRARRDAEAWWTRLREAGGSDLAGLALDEGAVHAWLDVGDLGTALDVADTALRRLQHAAMARGEQAWLVDSAVRILILRADVLARLGRHTEAVVDLRAAMTRLVPLRSILPPTDWISAWSLSSTNLVRELVISGAFEEVQRVFIIAERGLQNARSTPSSADANRQAYLALTARRLEYLHATQLTTAQLQDLLHQATAFRTLMLAERNRVPRDRTVQTLTCSAYRACSESQRKLGRLDGAAQNLRAELCLHRSLGDRADRPMLVSNYRLLAEVLSLTGRHVEALESSKAGTDILRTLPFPQVEAGLPLLLIHARILIDVEQVGEAREVIWEALRTLIPSGDLPTLPLAHLPLFMEGVTLLAHCHQTLGESQVARDVLHQARAALSELPDPPADALATLDRALAALPPPPRPAPRFPPPIRRRRR